LYDGELVRVSGVVDTGDVLGGGDDGGVSEGVIDGVSDDVTDGGESCDDD